VDHLVLFLQIVFGLLVLGFTALVFILVINLLKGGKIIVTTKEKELQT